MRPLQETIRRIGMKNLGAFYAYARTIHGQSFEGQGSHDVLAIILSYKRPQNIDLIVRSLLATPSVKQVILSNNNPALNIEQWLTMRSSRLKIMQSPVHLYTTERWRIAREHPSPYYLVVDDDLFVLPQQLERLCGELRTNPLVPHGIYGALRQPDGRFLYGVRGAEQEVDMLNRLYACTSAHVARFFELMHALHIQEGDAQWARNDWDDIVLSASGQGRSRIHDVGPIIDCPTQATTGIAVWREENFFPFREEFFKQLEPHLA